MIDCAIKLLTLCFFDPSRVYIAAETQELVVRPRFEEISWCGKEQKWCSGRMPAELRIGVEASLTRSITIDYGIGHRSFLDDGNDQGVEFVFTRLTWRPFK